MLDKKDSSLENTCNPHPEAGHITTFRDAITSMEVTCAHAVRVTPNKQTHTPDGKPIPRKTPLK